MKKNFISFIGIVLFFLFSSQIVDAQILQTRSEIIETYGTPFHSGISEEGENYLYYKFPVTTENSGTYHQRRVLFFKKFDNGSDTCYKWKILEPSTETTSNISSFTRNLVQIGDMEWKDYGKGIVYKVETVHGVCSITAWFDNKVELAKVYKM